MSLKHKVDVGDAIHIGDANPTKESKRLCEGEHLAGAEMQLGVLIIDQHAVLR